VALRALKLAEDGDEVVARVQETAGEAAVATLSGSAAIVAALEVDGAERPRAEAAATPAPAAGRLEVALSGWQPRAFALRLGEPPCRLAPPRCRSVALPFDLDGVSADADRGDGDFDGHGRTYPAELWPSELEFGGVRFRLGPTAPGERNVLCCRGQRLALAPAPGERLYLLAAGLEALRARLVLGGVAHELAVSPWRGFIGQWHRPRWSWGRLGVAGSLPPFLRRDPVAWVGSHTHSRRGDEPYVFCYLYLYRLPAPPGAGELVLPDEPRLRLFAATLAENPNDDTMPAGVLYD
jgi:alpha-mannosidase